MVSEGIEQHNIRDSSFKMGVEEHKRLLI